MPWRETSVMEERLRFVVGPSNRGSSDHRDSAVAVCRGGLTREGPAHLGISV
ncbi:hypothetical protein [Rhizobium giardinii]|uniref:hypothetical protein n=1 Tax=Rhizobium giardinii TaxID=56731 RepID=UPI003D6DF288